MSVSVGYSLKQSFTPKFFSIYGTIIFMVIKDENEDFRLMNVTAGRLIAKVYSNLQEIREEYGSNESYKEYDSHLSLTEIPDWIKPES